MVASVKEPRSGKAQRLVRQAGGELDPANAPGQVCRTSARRLEVSPRAGREALRWYGDQVLVGIAVNRLLHVAKKDSGRGETSAPVRRTDRD